MKGTTEYDVLKLVENQGRCYVSTDCVEGMPLIRYLNRYPQVGKEPLFSWMCETARLLEQFHKCRGNPCYQYLTPYSIIIGEEKKAYLLDFGSRSAEKALGVIRRRAVRESFQMPDNRYYQRVSMEDDIYSLGRTFQYMLAMANLQPPLTGREKRKLHKIIDKCLNQNPDRDTDKENFYQRQFKKHYQSFQEISEEIPKPKQITSKKNMKKFLVPAAIVTAAGAVFVSFAGTETYMIGAVPAAESGETDKKSDALSDVGGENSSKADVSENQYEGEAALQFDMGMLYLLEVKDYKKSRDIFVKIQDTFPLALEYGQLSSYLMTGTAESGGGLQEALTEIEERIPDTEDSRYYFSLLAGYGLLDGEEAKTAVQRLGEHCLELEDWQGEEDTREKEIQLRWSLGKAWETDEQKEGKRKAAKQYEALLELMEPEEISGREQAYLKLAELYETMDKEKAWQICRQGMEELEQSVSLRIFYIQMQCKDSSIARESCAETIKQCLKDTPEIAEEEAFEKLKQEYDIQVKGESVWVGR